MEFTAAASWLNESFAGFDSIILGFMDTLAGSAGGFLTPLMKFITLIGEKGLLMFLLAFVFMLFPKTRKAGVCIFGAVCCGALITNIILKDLVARPRPFESMARFAACWKALGSPAEDGFSFPSGHVTAITAGMAALCFTRGKKFIIPSVLVVLLMGVSRCYLMAHFPSDVLAAMIVGLISALLAWLIATGIFNYCEDNDDLPLFGFVLNFDPIAKIPALNTLLGRDGSKAPSRRGGKRVASARHAGGHSAEKSGPALPKLNVKLPGAIASRLPGKAGEEAEGENGEAAPDAPAAPAAPALPKLNIKLPQRSKRPTEDWNDRWIEYRSRKDSGQAAVSENTPLPEISFDKAETPAAPKADPEAPVLAEGDEDMKIAAPKAAKAPAAPAAEAAPAPKAEPAVEQDVTLDADAALLAELNFKDALMGEDSAPKAEPAPSRRRESARAAKPAASRRGGSGYRGKHEK